MTDDMTQISMWLPADLARWLKAAAALRGITRQQMVTELIEAEQREARPHGG